MSVTLKMTGLKKLEERLNRIGGEAAQKVADDVARAAIAVQNEMRRAVLKGPASGRAYRRGTIGKTKRGAKGYKFHRASAPGEAPATDSGNLASHINHVFTSRFSARAGVFNVPYASRLEFGGRDKRGVYIAPRPYLRPALKKQGPKYIEAIKKSVQEALRVR